MLTTVTSSKGGTFRRHERDAECPICAGHQGLRPGGGVRCAGFSLDSVSYCTREEYSGGLPLDISTSPPTFRHRLSGPCGCGREHGKALAALTIERPVETQAARLTVVERDAIYSVALDLLELRPEALADLTRRGLVPADVHQFGYRSIPEKGRELDAFRKRLVDRFGEERLRACPGFRDKNGAISFWSAFSGRDGYIVPYRGEAGLVTGLQLRRLEGGYETARGAKTADMYCVVGWRGNGEDLLVTEGGTKAAVAHHHGGVAVFGVPGQSLAPEHIHVIGRLQPRRVVVALDREHNRNTDLARDRWHRALADAGLPTYEAVWEGSDVGGPKGIDDLYMAGGAPRIRAVYFAPSELGSRRLVHETGIKGEVAAGMSLGEARRTTSKAIMEFVTSTGRGL